MIFFYININFASKKPNKVVHKFKKNNNKEINNETYNFLCFKKLELYIHIIYTDKNR